MITLHDISEPIEQNLQEFTVYLDELLSSDLDLVNSIVNYQSGTKGKQIRPMLVLLSALLFENINIKTYKAAGMVELCHTATLMHDDVIDEADIRRGVNTINNVWNNKLAILIGDYYFAKAFIKPIQYNNIEFLQVLINSIKHIIDGELLQIQKSTEIDLTENTYYKIINDKTASLISSSCKLGAISAGAEKSDCEKLEEFGYNIGMAFQIRDDILDYIGDFKITGKKPGNDLKEKKLTLPLIYALKQIDEKQANNYLALIKGDNLQTQDIKEIIDFVLKMGGIDYAQNKANDFIEKAIQLMNNFKDSPAKTSLTNFAYFIVDRQK